MDPWAGYGSLLGLILGIGIGLFLSARVLVRETRRRKKTSLAFHRAVTRIRGTRVRLRQTKRALSERLSELNLLRSSHQQIKQHMTMVASENKRLLETLDAQKAELAALRGRLAKCDAEVNALRKKD